MYSINQLKETYYIFIKCVSFALWNKSHNIGKNLFISQKTVQIVNWICLLHKDWIMNSSIFCNCVELKNTEIFHNLDMEYTKRTVAPNGCDIIYTSVQKNDFLKSYKISITHIIFRRHLVFRVTVQIWRPRACITFNVIHLTSKIITIVSPGRL